jgi:hypothetical protein
VGSTAGIAHGWKADVLYEDTYGGDQLDHRFDPIYRLGAVVVVGCSIDAGDARALFEETRRTSDDVIAQRCRFHRRA